MKKFIVLAMSVILLFSAIATPVSAAQPNDEIAQPYWTNTSIISADIVFLDGVGYAEGCVTGKFGSTNTYVDVVVYRQSGDDWIYVTEKHVSADYMSLGVSCEFTPTVGTYYKAEFTFTVIKNGTGEVIPRNVYKTYEN